MKKIKSGIRKDFEKINHTSKEAMLFAAGADIGQRNKNNLKIFKILPAAAVCIILISLCSILTLAQNGEEENIFIQLKNIFTEEPSAERIIEKSKEYSSEFCILLDHRNDDNLADDVPFYYRSVKDIVADLGDGLYYPSFEPFENDKNAIVMHTGRGIFDREKGEWESDYVFQISYCGTSGEILFWIELNNSNGGMHDPNAEEYERLGTTFYISDYCEELKGHFTAGELDGNYYSFIAENASQAKQIIDSLEKAE